LSISFLLLYLICSRIATARSLNQVYREALESRDRRTEYEYTRARGPEGAAGRILSAAVAYTREELDWMEGEWAFHLHGRSAFMSREDFLQLQAWAGEGVPADAIVGAMDVYFQRREKRAKGRGFVALNHLAKDVLKAVQVRTALDRAGAPAVAGAWDAVKEPLRSDFRSRLLYEDWKRLQKSAPAPDAPGFLDHFDAERKAFRELVAQAELRLGPAAEALRAELAARLTEANLAEGTLVWRRAWEHHWSRAVCDAWGIPG
jgi:hypothetical protein